MAEMFNELSVSVRGRAVNYNYLAKNGGLV